LFGILEQGTGNVQRPSRLTHAVTLKTKKAGEILFTVVWHWGVGERTGESKNEGIDIKIFFRRILNSFLIFYKDQVCFQKIIIYESRVLRLRGYD